MFDKKKYYQDNRQKIIEYNTNYYYKIKKGMIHYPKKSVIHFVKIEQNIRDSF